MKAQENNLIDVINLFCLGNDLSYKLKINQNDDQELNELISINKKLRHISSDNSLLKTITTPLGTLVDIENIKNYKIKSKDTYIPQYFSDVNGWLSSQEIRVNFSPRNEHDLSNILARTFSINDENLEYTSRIRLIETWAISLLDETSPMSLFNLNIESLLSYYEILILASTLNCRIMFNDSSPHYGYIDIGDDSIESEIAQKAFDMSTTYASIALTNKKNHTKYLLLGHKTYAYINIDWQSMIYLLYSKSNKFETDEIRKIKKKVSQKFNEKFPILSELFNTGRK